MSGTNRKANIIWHQRLYTDRGRKVLNEEELIKALKATGHDVKVVDFTDLCFREQLEWSARYVGSAWLQSQ